MSDVLVAGVGNLFLGDDGFGCEVARRLHGSALPSWLSVRDFGIRSFDLMLALERAERAIVIDAVDRGQPPGTLFVLEPSPTEPQPAARSVPHAMGVPHSMTASQVLSWASHRKQRGEPPHALVLVGCQPQTLGDEDDGCFGLSQEVAHAADRAAALVLELALRLQGTG